MKQSMNCRGKLIDLSQAHVMGIVNVTPDSFYDGGQFDEIDAALAQTAQHLEAGATFIDIGGVSTKPGAEDVTETEELERVIPVIKAIHKAFPEAILSIDTFRGAVAHKAVESGAALINDVSAGQLDDQMFPTVKDLQVPYILMHMQGTPKTMQKDPVYGDVVDELLTFFKQKVFTLKALGIHDLVIDPGFGFGKRLEHNYALLNNLQRFEAIGVPILAGISRKSMINKVLGTKPAQALNGTTALNMVALQNGARILRVHDVKEAMECVKLWRALHDMGVE